ncbi:MAG: GNAT family N-acetyltransferase [Candidatus Dormibacteraceae bacterium]
MIEVRAIEEETFTPWAAQVLDTFGGDGEDQESLRRVHDEMEVDRSTGAYDGPLLVGTTSSLLAPLTLPWGTVGRLSAVSAVTVRSTHRRRGILTQLMRRQLTEFHERGELLAGLWASEAPIYGRFGYGLGTFSAGLRIRRHESTFRRPLGVENVVEVDKETAQQVLPALQAAAAPGHPGFLVRSEKHWKDAMGDPPAWRHGASRYRFVLHQGPSAPDGYACYRTRHSWGSDGERQSKLEVLELHALNPDAYATLWRYCLDVDLYVEVEAWHRSVDEPLRHLLRDPRALGTRTGDGLWVRLVDVAPALAQRRYACAGELVLQIEDDFCPWNEGRVLLAAGAGETKAVATDREPDLVLDAAALAALYLGANRAVTLHRAGRIEERKAGALQRCDLLFAADATPWCPTGF